MGQAACFDGQTCHYCSAPLATAANGGIERRLLPDGGWGVTLAPGFRWPSTDHRTPRSRGGSDEPWNLEPACSECNAAKGARPYLAFAWGEPRESWGPYPSQLLGILRRHAYPQQLRSDLARLMAQSR